MSDHILRFIEKVALPEAPPGFEAAAVPAALETFGSGQAAVVIGDHLAEFSARVGSAERSQISDCLLLAQLAADHAKAGADLMAWYEFYVDTLKRTGWTVDAMEMKDTALSDDGLVVHKAIIPVLTAMLGPAAAAASMVVAVLKGLESMDKDSPWITLLNRSSLHVSGAKLQFGFVDVPEGSDQVAIRVLAVVLDAKKTVTQVLFFRLTRVETRLRAGETSLGISKARLNLIAAAVADRVRPFLLDNIAQVDLG